MSASPSGGPNGQRPTPPENKGPLPRIRKPAANNALVPRRKPHQRPAGVHAPGTPMPAAIAAKGGVSKPSVAKPQQRNDPQQQPNFEALRTQNGGWTNPPPAGGYQDYDLFVTKRALKEGLRFHVMRFGVPSRSTQQWIDPTDQDQFTRPVTLHRRDPRQPPPGKEVKEELPEETPEQAAESEKLAQVKAAREAQRAIDDAQKAPVMRDNAKGQPKQKEKKTNTQTRFAARTEQQKKENEIRYEEALPWHLEDADGKNVWVGQYEAPLSETKVALVISDRGFRMVPMEKWYKFSSKRSVVNALSIEEAEKVMDKKAPVSRWAMRDAQREQKEKLMADSRDRRGFVKQESSSFKQASRKEKMDHDDIDMSGDEFQDDDETAGFEPERDEDSKDSKDRIKREQLGANLFGDADEKEIDKELEEARKEEEVNKRFGKDLKKALKKRDKQFQYDSDDSEDRDPFASDSDSDSSSDDEIKKEDEKEGKDKADANSKGNNTPQGKKSASEAGKKGKSLKRAGSPMVSDSSGAESSRKKKKKTGVSTSSMTGSRSTTPLPGSQRRAGAGFTSDGEATGGEMSDGAGGKKKKKQHTHLGTSAQGTPSGSRAGSPNPASGKLSPNNDGASAPRSPGPMTPLTAKEIIEGLPADGGISLAKLLHNFGSRVGSNDVNALLPGQITRKNFIDLVKANSHYEKETKLLRRKKQGAGGGTVATGS